MEYESITQKVLLLKNSILQTAKQPQHEEFYFVVFGVKIITHGNPDSNIESRCISLISYQ
jgi:hypothetical protein